MKKGNIWTKKECNGKFSELISNKANDLINWKDDKCVISEETAYIVTVE